MYTYYLLGYFLYGPLFYFTQKSLDIQLWSKCFLLSLVIYFFFLCHSDLLFTLPLLKRTQLLSSYMNLVGSHCGVFLK